MMGTARRQEVPSDTRYAEIDGLRIGRLRLADAQQEVRKATRSGHVRPFQIATVNVDFLAQARRDPEFRRALQGCSLAVADGRPILWLSRYTEAPLPERVTGVDLTEWLLDGGVPSAKLFLLGATPEVLDAARARAEAHGTTVVGAASPDRAELTSVGRSARLVATINASGADVLLVALGAPLQETWTARWRHNLEIAVAIGVGCSLDVAAGVLTRAPERWQRFGFEWRYRLRKEPARLWRRYLLRDLPYLVSIATRTFLDQLGATRASRKEAS
jgi:N-acetylglucosaminyldiphosphoundecaprenol N-acetyl-beta-D-mannosaminyltransferase